MASCSWTQQEIYEGQLCGIHSRDNDLVVNPTKGKKLDNMRASGKDEVIGLVPPIKFTLSRRWSLSTTTNWLR